MAYKLLDDEVAPKGYKLLPEDMPVQPVQPRQKNSAMTNAALGFIGGAADIGSTLMTPLDWAARNAGNLPKTVRNNLISSFPVASTLSMLAKRAGLIGREDRREDIAAIQGDAADTDSLAYGGGKVSAYIAGTAGVPGAIARGVSAIPGATAALPNLLPAIQSGGMTAGKGLNIGQQALARLTGGAIAGGASAGLVDPSSAGAGAMVGGALPVAVQGAGMAGRGARNAAGWAATNTLGALTGTSDEAVRGAYQAGKSGAIEFLDNANNRVPMENVVDDLKGALQQMRIDRSNAYRSGMAQISGDRTILDMTPIQKAMQNVLQMGSFKGQAINKNAAGTVQELADQVNNWSALDPTDFHTPEGLDALKQSIGDIRDAAPFGSPSRLAADRVYNAVKAEINQQAPTYAKVMQDYSEASSTLQELEKALSAGNKASVDTTLRKLQSVMRNNAQTNYGNRLDLIKTVADKTGKDLMPALAGQAMNSWMPRGMVGAIEKAGLPALAVGTSNPSAMLAAPFMSPRLMGNAMYGLGAMSRTAGKALPAGIPMLPSQQGAMSTVPIMLNYSLSKNRP